MIRYILLFDWAGALGYHSGQGDTIRGVLWMTALFILLGILLFLFCNIIFAIIDINTVKQGNMIYIAAGIVYGLLTPIVPFAFQLLVFMIWRSTDNDLKDLIMKSERIRLSGITTNRIEGKRGKQQKALWKKMSDEEKETFKKQEKIHFKCREKEARCAFFIAYGLIIVFILLMNKGFFFELLESSRTEIENGDCFWWIFNH